MTWENANNLLQAIFIHDDKRWSSLDLLAAVFWRPKGQAIFPVSNSMLRRMNFSVKESHAYQEWQQLYLLPFVCSTHKVE